MWLLILNLRDPYAFSNYIFMQNIIGCCEEFVVIDLDNNEHDHEGQTLHERRDERGKELEVPSLLVLYTRNKLTFKK
jgi:hypothetical protein